MPQPSASKKCLSLWLLQAGNTDANPRGELQHLYNWRSLGPQGWADACKKNSHTVCIQRRSVSVSLETETWSSHCWTWLPQRLKEPHCIALFCWSTVKKEDYEPKMLLEGEKDLGAVQNMLQTPQDQSTSISSWWFHLELYNLQTTFRMLSKQQWKPMQEQVCFG